MEFPVSRITESWREFLCGLREKHKTEDEFFGTVLEEFKKRNKENINIMATVSVDIRITETNPTPPPPALTVDASGVPATATTGVPFSGVLKVSGGVPPYSFVPASGSLPSGLSLGADGTISGTPDGSDVPVGASVAFDDVINVVDSAV